MGEDAVNELTHQTRFCARLARGVPEGQGTDVRTFNAVSHSLHLALLELSLLTSHTISTHL